MQIAIIVVGAALALVGLLFMLGRRRGLAAGRLGRLLHMGQVSARLSTSFVGSRVRRAFARGARRERIDAERRASEAKLVAETMGQMKGAIMKLGQMLSFVSDDIPAEYRAALASLRASAPPMDFPLIRDVAERELQMPLERAFARFDEKPLASASIGQVHRAVLPSGEEVAVKIQYPGVAEAIRGDLANAEILYRMSMMFYPGVDPKPIVDELRGRITEELDYVREAKNQRAFADLFDGHPFIHVPRVIASHSTARVLTTELAAGRRFEEVLADPRTTQAERDRWGEILFRFVFGSIIRFGVFNGDPHPGNYLFTDDGKVVFLDFGCVKYFPEQMLIDWTALVSMHLQGDREGFRARAVQLGFLKQDAPISAELFYDYLGYFYEPFHADRDYAFTREYNGKSLRMVFAPEGRFQGMEKHLNMPPDFVFVNRIQWGVYSILAQLGATANWHRIDQEHREHAPPSTELGALDHAFRQKWLEARGLDATTIRYALTHDGVRPRRVA